MNLKSELEVERIFSYAVGLEQLGRQKNMIFGWEDIIYILNSDKTVILRFQSSKKEFTTPIGFYASDYDSAEFGTKSGFISFLKESSEFVRNKICTVPSQTFDEVEDLYFKFHKDDNDYMGNISFTKPSLDLLDESLSHIEFISKDQKIKILQRDIYSGTIIELERKKVVGLGLSIYEDDIGEDFTPLGMRTNDFLSLFSFNDKIKIYFLSEYFIVEGYHNSMTGVVAGCLYDSIGTINNLQEEKTNGRKESKVGNGVAEVNRKTEKKTNVLCRRRK